MKRKEALKIVDGLIVDLKELADKVNGVVQKTKNTPRITKNATDLFGDVGRNIGWLEDLRLEIESYDKEKVEAGRIYDMPVEMNCGLIFDDENEEE